MEQGERPRILVVDDDGDIARLIGSLLERKLNARVDIATDGAAARHAIGARSYDVITLDHCLPDCEGLDILEELAAAPSNPRVVMITGRGEDEVASRALKKGAFACAFKGSGFPSMLVETVGSALTGLKNS